VKPLEDVSIPELTEDQIQMIAETAEKRARDYINTKLPKRVILTLEIVIEAEGTKPLLFSIDINLRLFPLTKTYDTQRIVDEASRETFEVIEQNLRELSCKFKS
jgi:hypothetical protein